MNKIELVLEKRQDTRDFCIDGKIKKLKNKFAYFADVLIDGISLFNLFREHDFISILGWGKEEFQIENIDRLLLKIPSELESGRFELYVCPLCADLGCGGITINIEKINGKIVWKEFGLEYSYKDDIKYIDIGPFTFDCEEYTRTINSSLGLAGYGYPWD